MKIWLRAQQEQQSKREDLRQKSLFELQVALDTLSKKYHWTELFIFGSVQTPGRFKISSDLDVGISGLNSRDLYRFVADLSGILERNIDVLRLEESRLADTVRRKGLPWHRPTH